LAEEDRHRGKLDEEKQQFLFQNTRILVEDLAERSEELVTGNGSGKAGLPTKANARPDTARQPPAEMNVVCIPARDKADEIAALMLAQLLNKRGIGARALPSGVLAEDSLDEVRKEKAKVACVSAVPPFGYMHARYLCRRVRAQFRDVKLVGAILTERDSEEIKQRQPAILADQVAASLKEGLAQIAALINAPAALPPQPTLRPSSG
jgi:hypothetical protein